MGQNSINVFLLTSFFRHYCAWDGFKMCEKVVVKVNRCYSSLTSGRTIISPWQNGIVSPITTMSSGLEEMTDNTNLKHLLEPYEYISKVKKKEARSTYVVGLNHWLNLPADKLQTVVESFDLTYDYVMILDDLIDDPELRRGVPTVHKVYGYNRTLVTCSSLIILLIEKLTTLNKDEVPRLFNQAILRYFKGQSYETCWQVDARCPSMAEYNTVIELKVTTLYYFIIQMMQTHSKCKTDFRPFAKLLGYYYQYQNDYCNLSEIKYWKTKGYGEDITEGKYSLPIVHAIHTNTYEGDIVRNIILQKTKNDEMKRYCMQLMEKLGSLEYSKQLVDDAELKLRAEIDRLGGNEIMHGMIDAIKDWKSDEVPDESS